jgi:hypothetical protein
MEKRSRKSAKQFSSVKSSELTGCEAKIAVPKNLQKATYLKLVTSISESTGKA